MNRTALACVLMCISAQAAYSQIYDDFPPQFWDHPGNCSIQTNKDSWELKPDPDHKGEYLFTYTNSLAKCSDTITGQGVVASDGFRVTLVVEVGVYGTEDELIYVIPDDPQYMSYPAEIIAPDSSEPFTIRLIPGVS